MARQLSASTKGSHEELNMFRTGFVHCGIRHTFFFGMGKLILPIDT